MEDWKVRARQIVDELEHYYNPNGLSFEELIQEQELQKGLDHTKYWEGTRQQAINFFRDFESSDDFKRDTLQSNQRRNIRLQLGRRTGRRRKHKRRLAMWDGFEGG